MTTALASLLVPEGRWSVIRQDPFDVTTSAPDIGQPGLWSTITQDHRLVRVFELHESVLNFPRDGALDADDDQSMTDDCITWALATLSGDAPHGWRAPSRAEIEALMQEKALTIVSGTVARQGELILSANRLAIRFPILHSVPAPLAAPRHSWLREIISDARNHCRLARIGWTGEPGASPLVAEVDLTGAPFPALEPLLSTSLAALRYAVSWLVESAAFLADADVACRALEFGLTPQTQTERNTDEHHDH